MSLVALSLAHPTTRVGLLYLCSRTAAFHFALAAAMFLAIWISPMLVILGTELVLDEVEASSAPMQFMRRHRVY